MKLRLFGVMLAVVALQSVSQVSHAQGPTEAELDQAARITFLQGREAFSKGDYELALARFKQSYEMSKRAQLLYNIGTALDRLERDEEAIEMFEQYLQEVPDAEDRAEVERRIAIKREAVAKRAAEREVSEARDAELAAAKAEQARLEAERQRLEDENSRNANVVAEPPKKKGLPPIAFIAVASAAVAVAAGGIVTGILTKNKNKEYLADEDPATVQASYDAALSLQTITNVLFISAGVLGAAAVVMAIFTDWGGSKDKAPEPAGPQVSFGPNHLTLGYQGSF